MATSIEQLVSVRRLQVIAQDWTLVDKAGNWVPFRLNRCQRTLEEVYERQMDGRGYVRMNILKLRQGGITTWATAHGLAHTMFRRSNNLTIAHENDLPRAWLQRCRLWRDQTVCGPEATATQENALVFAELGSRYYVKSAQSTFAGMGDTLSFVHMSEVGSWDKTPVNVDPDKLLYDLGPAIPSGAVRRGTVIIRESTGKMQGDWWEKQWRAGKDDDDEYENVFLPWFLQEEYRLDDDAGDIRDLDSYEKDIVRWAKSAFDIELDKAQLAWRRDGIRQSPYHGNVDEWACRYPAYEEEAFLAPGLTIYTPEMRVKARATQRKPVWRGNVLATVGSPEHATFEANESGEMLTWEWPDENLHYVLGADCQWGRKQTADWDCLFVECLENGRTCAKVRGHWPMPTWARIIAAVGFKYNTCPVAPERNAQAGSAADGVLPALLGNTDTWRYPNVWVRTKEATIRPRVEDYGWWTDHTTKGEAIAFSQQRTLNGEFDWCDEQTIDQMATIIRHEDGALGAPKGSHDDDWMARLITGAVAHRQRAITELYAPPEPTRYTFTSMADRLEHMAGTEEEMDGPDSNV